MDAPGEERVLRYGKPGYLSFALIVMIITITALPSLSSDTLSSSKIIFENIPTNVEFFVNGLQSFPDEYNVLPVAPGNTLLEIKRERVVVYSAFFTIDPNEQKTISFSCDENCALLYVVTEPPGATLSMNGIILGYTPYMNRFIRPGSYSIMATLPGFVPVIRRINLSPTSDIELYKMEMSQVAKDSLEAAKRALQEKRQVKIAALCAVFGIGMVSAGAYYDWRAYTFLKDVKKAEDAYDNASTYAECQKQKEIYYAQRENMKKPLLYRDVFYGTAAASFIACFFSLVF